MTLGIGCTAISVVLGAYLPNYDTIINVGMQYFEDLDNVFTNYAFCGNWAI